MKNNRDKFLEALNIKKLEFEQALQRLMKNQKEYHENLDGSATMDELDQAQREISVSSNYSLIERKARELKQIDRLIRQIVIDSEFGICEECGNPIPTKRLLIVPEATLCVPCQRELEKFDHLRKLSKRSAFKMGMENLQEDEDIFRVLPSDGDLIDPGLEILPLVGMEETDTSEDLQATE
ncbi:MAG: TraR/DksA family transcriptional regulator [Desulfatiglandaceae bacterium]